MNTPQRRLPALLLLLVSAGLSGCFHEDEIQEPWQFEDVSIPVDQDLLLTRGKNLYERQCIRCHRKDGRGEPRAIPSLTNPEFLSFASDRFLNGVINDGRPSSGMPSFKHLGNNGIRAIIAYLRSYAVLPDISLQVDAEPAAQGDPGRGKQWYEQKCAHCHGSSGSGYLLGGIGPAIGRAGFLDMASDGYIRQTVKYGRSNSRMDGFQGGMITDRLSDQDIEDIIVHLRSLRH